VGLSLLIWVVGNFCTMEVVCSGSVCEKECKGVSTGVGTFEVLSEAKFENVCESEVCVKLGKGGVPR
jgi:hypothetical protein